MTLRAVAEIDDWLTRPVRVRVTCPLCDAHFAVVVSRRLLRRTV